MVDVEARERGAVAVEVVPHAAVKRLGAVDVAAAGVMDRDRRLDETVEEALAVVVHLDPVVLPDLVGLEVLAAIEVVDPAEVAGIGVGHGRSSNLMTRTGHSSAACLIRMASERSAPGFTTQSVAPTLKTFGQ